MFVTIETTKLTPSQNEAIQKLNEIQKLLEKSSMNDILVKPFEWLDLLHIIEKHIQS